MLSVCVNVREKEHKHIHWESDFERDTFSDGQENRRGQGQCSWT